MSDILCSSLGTLERRRGILLTTKFSVSDVVGSCLTILRREIWEMTFWSWILGSGKLIGPTCKFQGCMVSKIMYCPSELDLKTFDSSFIGSIS
jgi:hypothetical protein